MADDNFPQRPHRASQPPVRNAPSGAPSSSSGSDPLAELARLIGQTDPFGEYGRDAGQPAAAPAPQPADYETAAAQSYDEPRYAPAPEMAPPPDQHDAAGVGFPEEAYAQGPVPGYGPEPGQADFEQGPYYPNIPHEGVEEEHYYDDVPPRRRMGILAIAAVLALAVIGTAGAFGYRALFGSSAPSGPPPVIKADTKPSKVIPAQTKEAKDAKPGKLIYDRVANGAQNEKLVSREEQPVAIGQDKTVGTVLPQSQSMAASGTIQPSAMGSGIVGVEPKKVHTIAIRPDQVASAASVPPAAAKPSAAAPAPKPAPVQAQPEQPARATAKPPAPAAQSAPRRVAQNAASRNAPLSLNPNAAAPAPTRAAPSPARTRAAPTRIAPAASSSRSASASGGYAVQVASRHNEADARASLRSLQAKFPQQLGGHSPLIRRVDLGAKGIYYRAMVGPFGSADEASRVCSSLKAAGGDCLVQKI
jgi:hypothetical protein